MYSVCIAVCIDQMEKKRSTRSDRPNGIYEISNMYIAKLNPVKLGDSNSVAANGQKKGGGGKQELAEETAIIEDDGRERGEKSKPVCVLFRARGEGRKRISRRLCELRAPQPGERQSRTLTLSHPRITYHPRCISRIPSI